MGAAEVMRAEWIDAIGREHVLQVAHALGLEVQPAKNASGGSFSCPVCNALRRHPSRRDPRLAVGVRAEGRGWRCFQCDASGDQLHLVALALCGRRFGELGEDDKGRVRAWVIDWLRLGVAPSSTPARPRLELVVDDTRARSYPPDDEVLAFWTSLQPITTDPRIAGWLENERGLAAVEVASSGICRALPRNAPCPAWAAKPAIPDVRDAIPWSKTAYRAIFPMFDHTGAMRNVLARYVGKPKSERAPKSRAAAGFSRAALVLANRAGYRLLAGKLELGEKRLRVVVAEGEMDVLAFAIGGAKVRAIPDVGDEVVAVLGVVSGSWTPELAARIPDGATVLVATHNDKDGEKYARAIAATLVERMKTGAIRAERWRAR